MNVGLVVPGSEQTIVEGIQDALKKGNCKARVLKIAFYLAGIACFGPSKYGATLEGSKAFAKEFMDRYSIPTAEYKVCCARIMSDDSFLYRFSQIMTKQKCLLKLLLTT